VISLPADLIEKWRNKEGKEEPENYQPEVCPPGLAQDWTNTENPGNSDHGKWQWDLLVDLAFVADSNPNTVKDDVKTLLQAVLTDDEREKVREEIRGELS
jgi:hypothetical protein